MVLVLTSGCLLASQVVVDMVKNRLAQPDAVESGWLLDGYPRSAEQAEAIEQASIRPDLFLLINVRTPPLLAAHGRSSHACLGMRPGNCVDQPGQLYMCRISQFGMLHYGMRTGLAGPRRAAGGADRGAAQRPRDGRHIPPHLPAAARGRPAPPGPAQRRHRRDGATSSVFDLLLPDSSGFWAKLSTSAAKGKRLAATHQDLLMGTGCQPAADVPQQRELGPGLLPRHPGGGARGPSAMLPCCRLHEWHMTQVQRC